jgi:RimJ/RimL family protein N-acetyltransferase
MPVRAATPEDALAIASVHVESWRTAYRGQMPDEVLASLSVDRRAEMWRNIITSTSPWKSVLVLDRADIVEGFAHVCQARDPDVDSGVGEVSAIYLLPPVWGQGFGRELMAAALRQLAESGLRSAILWVLETNDRARRFYEAGGWRRDGTKRTERIEGARVDEVRYRREVGSEGFR